MSLAHGLALAALAALRADATLAADLGGRLWDVPPRDPAFPHLVLDDVVRRDRSGLDTGLDEVRLTLRVLARDGGRVAAARLAERAETVLLAADLACAGAHVVLLRHETSEIRLGRDRRTAEATVRFVALIEPV